MEERVRTPDLREYISPVFEEFAVGLTMADTCKLP